MITVQLNKILVDKKLVSTTELKKLDAEQKTQKTPITWEDFLVDKNIFLQFVDSIKNLSQTANTFDVTSND